MKRPAFQFYPGDWLRDAGLRSCSVGARGLWMDMLCHMHDGSTYGYLKVGGKVILPAILARMSGCTISEVEEWLKELSDANVYSVLEDGCIYSRRMIRDEEVRQQRAAGGHLGGNPNLKPKDGVRLTSKVKQKPTPSSASSSSSAVDTPIPPETPIDDLGKKAEREALRVRLGGFFNRRADTKWDEKEMRAFAKLKPLSDDVDLLEWFYKLPMPPEKPFEAKQPVHLRRRDLYTLLNNWAGEVDKAIRQDTAMMMRSAPATTNINANDVESFDQAR